MKNTHDQGGSAALPEIERTKASTRGGRHKGKNRRARARGSGGDGKHTPPPPPSNTDRKRPSNAERKMWSRYGLDEESYTLLFEKQNCVCPICKEPLEKHGSSTVVNYERVPGYKELTPRAKRAYVRALLCRPCDAGVRMFRGSEAALIGAVVFLRTY